MSGLKPFHVATFAVILASGLAFLAGLLYFTADMQFQRALLKVIKRLLKTVALRQVLGILAAMTFVRFGLEPLVKVLRRVFSAQGTWEKSSEYYILREVGSLCWLVPAVTLRLSGCLAHPESVLHPARQVYRPLEFLFSVAALTTLAENFLPQLISLPKV